MQTERYLTDISELTPDDVNFNEGTQRGDELMDTSIRKFGLGRSILIDKNNKIIAGNKTAEKASKLGKRKVLVVETDGDTLVAVKRTDIDLDSRKGRELAMADNATSAANLRWATDMIMEAAPKWGIDPKAWDIPVDTQSLTTERDFTENDSETNQEYEEFKDKFKPKLTTDDCYTPPKVYDAVLQWVRTNCNLSDDDIIMRPFKPGGDYTKETYTPKTVVVDNPPFSIFTEIVRFYEQHCVRFFLFANHLTLFSPRYESSTRLVCNGKVVYENGANVNTSFVTNMIKDSSGRHIEFMTAPTLLKAIEEAQVDNSKAMPVYGYPPQVVSAALLGKIVTQEFRVYSDECQRISQLDCQKESGKAIYGGGYLINDKRAAEVRAAEVRAAEERRKQQRIDEIQKFPLSEREIEIVRKLGNGKN